MIYSFYILCTVREFLILIFSRNYKAHQLNNKKLYSDYIAIFYTTYNDFNATALRSLLGESYVNKTIYVLDDSEVKTLKNYLKDNFSMYDIVYMYRENRKGFKAGNINFGLHNLPSKYEYIFLADAEQIIPYDCINTGINFLKENTHLSFVQWTHRPIVIINGDFPQSIADAYGLHSKLEMQWRSILNTVPSIGHGTLIRRAALVETNGLPEIVSEDFAWSLTLLAKNQHGALLDLEGFEEGFPNDFYSYTTRYKRWCRADYECAKSHLLSVITAKSLPLFARIDVVFRQLKYIMASLVAPFGLLEILIQKLSYDSYTNMFIILLSILSIFSPLLIVYKSNIFKNAISVIDIFFICYSQIWVLFYSIVKSLLGLPNTFEVTGSRKVNNTFFDYYLHIVISIILIIWTGLDFTPLKFFMMIVTIGFSLHQKFKWNNPVSLGVRIFLFIYTLIWVGFSFYFKGIWIDDLRWFITASAIIL